MRNRAKCKKCNKVIESFHLHDYVNCSCGEISVSGGSNMYCAAINWDNFLRVDDMDNVIVVQVSAEKHLFKQTKKELLEMLKIMIENIEKLPEHVLQTPISHYDHLTALMLIYEIAKYSDDVT